MYLEDGSTAGRFFCLPHSGEMAANKLNGRVEEKGSGASLVKELNFCSDFEHFGQDFEVEVQATF